MTSYSQNDYYFNEIDALSCNNRPISSTLRSKSTCNAYESQTEDEIASYDLYGNQEYNDGSSCDSYNHQQRSTSTMSNAGNYSVSFYNNDYTQVCKNVITTDNLMYHRDACSGDSSDRYDIYSTLDYGDYDNLKGECFNYGSTTVADENGRSFTSLGDSNNKILPQVPPVQHGHSMWDDGMYGSGQYRQSNVSLPSTPSTLRYNCGSSVGGREMGFSNGDWDRGFIANGVKAQLNGHRNYDHSSADGGVYGKKPPERILPLPQSQSQTYVMKSLKQQIFQDNTNNMATTTAISSYQNPTNIIDYKRAMPVSSSNQNLPSHNLYYDNGSIIEPRLSSHETDYNNSYSLYESRYSIEPRPHTAMQTTDEYNDFGLNDMDNMSTYSDTNIPIGSTTTYANQQKLQDLRKCRYSIIMAMTTASVIASGETRIPQHLLKKTLKTTSGNAADISTTTTAPAIGLSKADTSADMTFTSINSYSYDDSGGIVCNNKNISSSGSSNLISCAYTNVTMKPNQSVTGPVTLPAAASPSMLLLSSASPIVADSTTSNGFISRSSSTVTATTGSHNIENPAGLSLLKNLTSRKLPKHHTGRGIGASKQLPQSPQYPLSHNTLTSKTLPNIPQTSSSLKATNDTLDNINTITSTILSTTATTSSTSTTSSSLSSTFSLLSYHATPLVSNSFKTTTTTAAAKTDAIAGETTVSSIIATTAAKTTTAATDTLPNNNNNNMKTDMKSYDNFNNYKNNNFYINNVLNTDDKYCIESSLHNNEDEIRTQEENAEVSKEKEEFIYHLSTMPSRLSSLANITDKVSTEPYHKQFKITTGTAYDTLNSSLSSLGAVTATRETDTVTATVTTTTMTTTQTSSVTTAESSGSIYDSDYKTSYDIYDYADYLKPYTLPTYSTSNTSSSSNDTNTNLQFTLTHSSNIISSSSSSYLPYPSLDIHKDYLTFSSSITTDTSTALTTTLTSSSASASTTKSENATANASTILAINNRGLDNIITALNLSDNNISRKSSISSPVMKVASPSGGSVDPITSILCYATKAETITTTTTALSSSNVETSIASLSSNTLPTYLDHVSNSTLLNQNDKKETNKGIATSLGGTKADTNDSFSSSLCINDYDNYLKDYNIDFIEPSAAKTSITSSSSSTTHTLATTTPFSSTLNKSWPTSTMMSTTKITTIKANDNNCFNTINNNEVVVDVAATTSTLLSFTPDCLFTTTKTTAAGTAPTTAAAAELTTTPTKDSLTTTAANSSTTPALYADYLKDYNSTVTASSSASFVTEVMDKPAQELPAYIMDFLITTKSNEYEDSNYLNLYKIKEEDSMLTDGSSITSDISSLKATNNNNIISNSQMPATTKQEDASDVSTSDMTIMAASVPSSVKETMAEAFTASLPMFNTTYVTISSVLNETPATDTIDNQLTALNIVDFDDNFYNSFSVNLNSLMSETTAINSTSEAFVGAEGAKPSYTTSSMDTFNANTSQSFYSMDGSCGNLSNNMVADNFYTTTGGTTTLAKATAATAPSTATIQSSKSVASSNQKPTTAGVKAASMLGGLSQSLKGGLDGVLGAAAAAGSNEPQQPKRGFGFGLASKFVPNVGGLLGSATKSTTPSTTCSTQPSKIVAAPPQTNETSYKKQFDSGNEVTTTSAVTSANFNNYFNDSTTSTESFIIASAGNNKDTEFVASTLTSDIYDHELNDAGSGALYYNSSQAATYYHMTSSLDYAKDEMANHSDQMMMYDDAVTGDTSGGMTKEEYYADENQAFDMYGGYSEYETVSTTGNSIKTSLEYTTSTAVIAPAKTTTAVPASASLPISAPASTSMQSTSNSSTVTAAKKATSSLLSSLTNVASQISQQTSTAQPTATTVATVITSSSTANATSTKATTGGSGGGMFGSIFGKAAAAMQTATQVVNQGASMASTKVQKNLQATSAVALNKRMAVATTDEPATTCTATTTTAINYQRGVMGHQDSLVSPYTSSLGGDDYDNSNIPTNADGEFAQYLDEEEYYYNNQSQTQQQLIHQQSQQKLLPTVPPGGGSTGKKLPTINDKSGCLVKQQPTEIYEEDTEVPDHKSQAYLKKLPTYDIDSEQADYYMDTQPVAPSAARQHMAAANGYYEHTNGGSYDYRDDYFNEEDEFKYLEKEEILDNKQQHLQQQQHQQQLRQIRKQSSLQYVVDDDYQQHGENEIMDEYMDDMYHSEDSGNYLDESSSGSVKGLVTTHQPQVPSKTVANVTTSLEDSHILQTKTSTSAVTTTTTTMPVSSTMHQQIKKQDSIILEEDEKDDDDISAIVGTPHDMASSPSKSLSRKSSHDMLETEHDQMGDLQMVSASLRSSQSRKMKLMRGETEEVVGGQMQIMKRKTEVTAKQRWHWAYNKIILQLNVSRIFYL